MKLNCTWWRRKHDGGVWRLDEGLGDNGGCKIIGRSADDGLISLNYARTVSLRIFANVRRLRYFYRSDASLIFIIKRRRNIVNSSNRVIISSLIRTWQNTKRLAGIVSAGIVQFSINFPFACVINQQKCTKSTILDQNMCIRVIERLSLIIDIASAKVNKFLFESSKQSSKVTGHRRFC